MQTQRGFIGLPVLIAIVLGLIVVGGGAYFVMQQQAPTKTASENNVDTLPTTQTTTCVDLNSDLIIGSTDATTNGEVSKLQRFLGAYTDLQPVNGYYDSKTAANVMQWQKAHGMDFVTLTSGVGPMTRAKMKCGNTTNQAVQKISWNIEKANPSITDPNDYHQSEQTIAVDVTFADNSIKRYNLGTAYGCTGSTVQSTENGKTVLGKINCYYALAGVGFVAYSQNGKFVVERGDESAKDGSIKTTVLLQI